MEKREDDASPPIRLRCNSCHRVATISRAEIANFGVAGDWPRCCGEVMSLLLGEAGRDGDGDL